MSVITPSNRGLIILLSSLVLVSAAAVPLSGATNGAGQGEAFKSFEVEFKPADPEAPNDVVLHWNLNDDATEVQRIRIAFTSENNETINLFKPNDTDVPNPFTVTAADDRNGSSDIVVDDLASGTIQLKVPVGQCDRIDSVQVFAYSDNETVTEPNIQRGVSCGSDTDSGTFAVSIDHYDETVTAGETVTLTATVENTGETEATQDLRFLVDGEEVDVVENLTLSGNQSEELSFVYETTDGDVPAIGIAVESDDEGDERTVTVDEPDPAFFAVSIENTPAAVAAGETVEVTVRVENTGDRAGTQNVTLAGFDGKTVDTSEPVTLSADESTTITLVWPTESTDVGEGTITVWSENETDTATVTVDQPAVESIDATLEEAEIETGEKTSITVVATFTDGSTRDVTENATLTALDTDVATVADDGTITAESDGTTEIESVFENETDADTLTVKTGESDGSDSDSGEGSNDDDGADVGDDDGDEADAGDDGDEADAGDDGDEADAGDDGDEADAGEDGDEADAGDDGDESDAGDDGDEADAGDDGDEGNAGDDGDEADVGDDGEANSDPTAPDRTYEGDSDWPDDAPADEGDDDGTTTDTDAGDESDGTDSNGEEGDVNQDEGNVDEDDAVADSTDDTGESDETNASSIVVFPLLGLLLLAPLLVKRRR